jgi:enamine deaminase RidA (YjgF/YER057c/UK114 family)
MSLEYIAPEGIHEARGYTHVVKATGSTTVYISGQVGVEPDGKFANGLEGQSVRAYENLAACLKSVGAGPEHVAKITTFVVDYTPEKREAVSAGRRAVFGQTFPASTLVGVQALAAPQIQIEVEAVVVMD